MAIARETFLALRTIFAFMRILAFIGAKLKRRVKMVTKINLALLLQCTRACANSTPDDSGLDFPFTRALVQCDTPTPTPYPTPPTYERRRSPKPWETSLQSNAASHWLGANLESALSVMGYCIENLPLCDQAVNSDMYTVSTRGSNSAVVSWVMR